MSLNATAQALKGLHIPSNPLVLANIWDISSLNVLTSLNSSTSSPVKAIATASWAIAASNGIPDEDLDQQQNLDAISRIAPLAAKAGLPLSADLQDGYGDKIADTVRKAVKLGVVGANIEDSIPSAGFDKGIAGSLYSLEDQVNRLRSAMKAADEEGCPDFALNARCDAFVLAPSAELTDEARLDAAIARGKAFLELGATTVFYWGPALGRPQIERLVKELGGRVAIQASAVPGMTVRDLAQLGVARISVGPAMYRSAMNAIKEEALKLLQG
ncbi:phosphoenolpyruvate phosphomutase domain-containing protein [Sarocladium implicatum]|nr:phosphoenolpyruvate phosphomutase domain-containing protein [Sarocladium implicatum]